MKTQKLTLTQLMQDAEVIEKENLNSIKGGQQEVT
jgi:natural product precursor